MFSDYQRGGRDNLCSIHVPVTAMSESPILPLAVLLSTSLLSSSSQVTHLEKTQERRQLGTMGRKIHQELFGIAWSKLVGRCIFVMPRIATSKTVLLFMRGM